MPKALLIEKGGSGGGGGVVLQRIEIEAPPTQVEYLAGDVFNDTGMVLKGYYGVGGTTLTPDGVLLAGYNVTPNPLTDGTTEVTITYSETGVTCTATQPITVRRKLTSITLDSAPTKTTYEYSDTLVTTGMVVRAHYSDGSSAVVTGATCSPTTFNARGTQEVIVSYTENQVYAVTKTTTFNVTVERKTVTEPSWKGTLTYNGTSQSATGTSLWNNYNATYMDISGTTSGTNATSYNATFTTKDNYRFGVNGSEDTMTTTKSWSIAKKTLEPIVTGPSAKITASSLTQNVSISGLDAFYSGTISGSCSQSGVTVGSVTGSGATRTIPVTGNGSTAGTFTITVSFGSDSNYNTISNATATVTAEYWTWGSETDIGDATWWAGLKSWVQSASDNDLKGCLGKTKSVTLTSAVQGTTTHLVRCVAYNCDGAKTLTFQTANCLATKLSDFGSNAQWIGSNARTQCTNYYNAFPGKASIKTTKQGTNTDYNSASVQYNDETVFLPSIFQMNLTSYAYNPKADEYCQNQSTPYQYYANNSTREKQLEDSGSADSYWTRSRASNFQAYVCIVTVGGVADFRGYNKTTAAFAPAFVIG